MALPPNGPGDGPRTATSAHQEPAGDRGPTRGRVGLLSVGIWLALLIGWLDIAITVVNKFAFGAFIHRSPHLVWMTPLAYVLMFGPPAAVLALVSRRWPRLISFRTGAFILAFPAALSLLILLFYQRIYDVALLALAIGLAVQTARLAANHGIGFSKLVRRMTPVMALVVVLSGLVVGVWRSVSERSGVAGLPAARAGAPNVLLIILDTVRSASLGLYGYERETTPRLERFAEQGVVFDQAIAPSSWTLPSHASLFTGLEPQHLSVGWLSPLDDADPTLAEVLRDRGYTTAGFVANLQYAMYETGLDRGFLRFSDYQISPGQILLHSGLGRFLAGRRTLRTLVGTDEVVARRTADDINDDLLGWLDGVEGRPFFAFVNYYDAHDPYLPPDEFFRKLTGQDRPNRLSPLRRLTVRQRRDGVTPEDLKLEIDSYDASIAYLDDRVGRLLDEFERRGILENTVVVITSDHGEEFGEHGAYFHGHTLYMPSLHVPLIVAYPGGASGVRVIEPVSLTDLAATIADLAGAEGTTGLGGRSLANLWTTGMGASVRRPRAELQEGIRLPEWYPVALGDMSSIIADGLHYILNGDGREELFDVVNDPWEQRDLAGSPAAQQRLDAIRQLLDERRPPR